MFQAPNMYNGIIAGENLTKLNLVSMTLQETGTFRPQYNRPYTAVLGSEELNHLATRVEEVSNRSPGCRIESSLVAGLTSGLIAPAAEAEKMVGIMNGWEERRFRFTLVVEEQTRLGTAIYQFQGYSEYFSLSMGNHIDPNMVFFINSYVQINRTANPMLQGSFTDRIVESRTLTNGYSVTEGKSELYGIRAPDLFAGLQANYVSSGLGDESFSGLLDSRNGLSKHVFATKRMSAIPAQYLSGVIDNYRSAQTQADYGIGMENVYDRAINCAHEKNIYENKFIRELTNLRGITMPVNDFTINQLLRLDPTFASRINYQPVEDINMLSDYRADVSGWDGRDMETQIASVLSRAIPALMLDCGMITCHFSSSNMTVNGIPLTEMFAPGITVSTDNAIRHYNNFISRFDTEVFPDISRLNMIALSVMVSADIYNEIHIKVQLDGRYETDFRYPCFCDAMMQPTMTVNKDRFTSMVTGAEEIINYCGISPSSPYGSVFNLQSV